MKHGCTQWKLVVTMTSKARKQASRTLLKQFIFLRLPLLLFPVFLSPKSLFFFSLFLCPLVLTESRRSMSIRPPCFLSFCTGFPSVARLSLSVSPFHVVGTPPLRQPPETTASQVRPTDDSIDCKNFEGKKKKKDAPAPP